MTRSRAGSRWTWLALAIAAAVVYGSFVPLRWRESSGLPVSAQVRAIPFAPLANLGSSDFFTNLLVTLPLGFSGAAALAARSRPRISSVLRCSVLCAVLAMAIEFGQLFVRDRTAAWSDVFALTAGGVAGALVWSLAGPGILAWLRQIAHGDTTAARLRRVLDVYVLILVGDRTPALAVPAISLSAGALRLAPSVSRSALQRAVGSYFCWPS